MMKTVLNHLINQRTLTCFNPIEKELELNPHKNYLFDLAYLDVIDVKGDKAIDFLQGQLTCNLNSISNLQMIQGAQCNLKGRILALMDIILWQGVKLVLPHDITEATINSLNKAAMLSRVSFQPNDNLRVFGFYLQNQADKVPDSISLPKEPYALRDSPHSCCYHLGSGFYILLAQPDWAAKVHQCFMDREQLLGSLTWHTLRLTHQQIDIYPESRGLFLPHRLGLQHSPYISFNKGCYKGQEIIARMHYKATIKHQLEIHKIKSAEKIHSGQKLLKNPEGTELGELVDYSILGHEHYLVALSVLKKTDANSHL